MASLFLVYEMGPPNDMHKRIPRTSVLIPLIDNINNKRQAPNSWGKQDHKTTTIFMPVFFCFFFCFFFWQFSHAKGVSLFLGMRFMYHKCSE